MSPPVRLPWRRCFVEIAFRKRGEEIARDNANLADRIRRAERENSRRPAMRVPGNLADGMTAWNQQNYGDSALNYAELR